MSDSLLSPQFVAPQIRLLWNKRHHFQAGEKHFASLVPAHALWLVLEGRLDVQIEGRARQVDGGEVFLSGPCRNREVVAQGEASWLSIGFHTPHAPGFDWLQAESPRILKPSEARRAQLEELLATLIGQAQMPGQGAALLREGLALATLGWCLGALETPESGRLSPVRDRPPWLFAVLSQIEAHPAISVENLARQAHFSAAQFRRVFVRHMGLSPQTYLRRRRLERARLALEGSDIPLFLVAEQAGWGSPGHFSREFKVAFGMSPAQWRQASRTML